MKKNKIIITLLNRSLDLRREKLAGEIGEEEGVKRETRLLFLGVVSPVVVLHLSFGVPGRDGEEGVAVATAVAVEVRQRRL